MDLLLMEWEVWKSRSVEVNRDTKEVGRRVRAKRMKRCGNTSPTSQKITTMSLPVMDGPM